MPETSKPDGLDPMRIAHIDEAVVEVFETMLRQHCAVVEEVPVSEMALSATIRFSGAIEGRCVVRVSTATAYRLTCALLGTEGTWDDAIAADAVSELCNMIAGGWKSRLNALASTCHLSVPEIERCISGSTPEPEIGPGTGTRRVYEFDGSVLEVALTLRQS